MKWQLLVGNLKTNYRIFHEFFVLNHFKARLHFYNPWKHQKTVEIGLREKCPNTELFLVRIFLNSDWIRGDTVWGYTVCVFKLGEFGLLKTFLTISISPKNAAWVENYQRIWKHLLKDHVQILFLEKQIRPN